MHACDISRMINLPPCYELVLPFADSLSASAEDKLVSAYIVQHMRSNKTGIIQCYDVEISWGYLISFDDLLSWTLEHDELQVR